MTEHTELSQSEQLEAKYSAAAAARGGTAWTVPEYLEICAARNLEYAEERKLTEREDFAVLAAVGLLHPDMTGFELGMFGLARSVWEDPTLLAAVVAQEGPIPTEADENGCYELYLAEAYAVAFAAMTQGEQKTVRERILALPGWQRWAATKA